MDRDTEPRGGSSAALLEPAYSDTPSDLTARLTLGSGGGSLTSSAGVALRRILRLAPADVAAGSDAGCGPACSSGSRLAAGLTTAQVAATKIFLGGVGWQAFALASRRPSTSRAFAVAAGLGDASGTFVGNALLLAALAPWRGWPGAAHVVRSGLVVSAGSLLSGSAWQPLVTTLHGAGLGFNAGAACTGAACGAAFYVGITLAAMLNARECRRPASDLVKDFTLSLAVVGATAAFVGTDARWHGNWLQPLVGERHGQDYTDCLKAGFSVVVGFGALQLLLVLLVPPRFLWTTPDAPERCTFLDERGAAALRPSSRSLAPTWSSAMYDRSTAGTLARLSDLEDPAAAPR